MVIRLKCYGYLMLTFLADKEEIDTAQTRTPQTNVRTTRPKNSRHQSLDNSSLWKRVIDWERSRAASGYGIILGDADRNIQEEFSAECHSVDWF